MPYRNLCGTNYHHIKAQSVKMGGKMSIILKLRKSFRNLFYFKNKCINFANDKQGLRS